MTEAQATKTASACLASDCTRPVLARMLCNTHYSQARRLGELDTYPTTRADPQTRFWARVEKTRTCWLWVGLLSWDGYGVLGVNGKNRRAHRLAWEWLRGPIPDGKVIDHRCRIRNCVNPDHMELVTSGENTLRGISFSAIHARATHCKNGHEFTPDNTYLATTGQRVCRTCKNERNQRYRARKREATA